LEPTRGRIAECTCSCGTCVLGSRICVCAMCTFTADAIGAHLAAS
jgi:hypothetical protein